MTIFQVIMAVSNIYIYTYILHIKRKEKKKPSDNPSLEDYFNTFDFREIGTDSPKQAALT